MKLIQYIKPSNPNHHAAIWQNGKLFEVKDGDVMILFEETRHGWHAISKYGMCTVWHLSDSYRLLAHLKSLKEGSSFDI